MSNIRIDNIAPSAGGTYRNAPRGIAAAWVSFDGVTTSGIYDSENVSSFTDNAIGDYSVNITNAFANNNYCAEITGVMNMTSSGVYVFGFYDFNNHTTVQSYKTSSLVRICGRFVNPAGASAQDSSLVCLSTFGDLA